MFAYYADQQIKSMEHSWSSERDIIELSKKANILTRHTAFIGVNTGGKNTTTNSSATEANQVTRNLERMAQQKRQKKMRDKQWAKQRQTMANNGGGYVADSATMGYDMPMAGGMPRMPKSGAMRSYATGPPPEMLCGGATSPPRAPMAGCAAPRSRGFAPKYLADSAAYRQSLKQSQISMFF